MPPPGFDIMKGGIMKEFLFLVLLFVVCVLILSGCSAFSDYGYGMSDSSIHGKVSSISNIFSTFFTDLGLLFPSSSNLIGWIGFVVSGIASLVGGIILGRNKRKRG